MSTPSSSHPGIDAELMLPELLHHYPQVRPVLDRYGLRGCGGQHGPAESIEYFARAHGIDLEILLHELQASAAAPQAEGDQELPGNAVDHLADTIYRRFFKGGIVVVLTAGAVWGALLLMRIALSGDFKAVTIHEINAHGHAQIFGWVGLFVMGFAYQAFPRMKHTNLWRPDLAILTFYLMVGSIFLRAVGEPLFHYPLLRAAALVASGIEVFAIALFVAIIWQTLRRSGKPLETHDFYILAALCFFLLQAVYEVALLYASTSAPTREALLAIIATWQAPLRDLHIHGFAMLMILGVGLRMFPALFGFHAPGKRMAKRSLYLLIAAIIGEVIAFLMMRYQGHDPWVGIWYGSVILLACVSMGLTFQWGLLAKPTETDRATKYIRAGVYWLHTSMVMLVAAPLYMYVYLPQASLLSPSGVAAVEMHFSHAYYGAVRHAVTVGFISLTILGMAGKIVPTLKGVDTRHLSKLWIPFLLVNAGCAMRVIFQIMTDLDPRAYPLAGVSGVLEVTGIAIWGVHLWRIMNRKEVHAEPEATDGELSSDSSVGAIIDRYPEALPILIAKGFTPLKNPWLRNTLARTVSLRTAARTQGLDPAALLAELKGEDA